MSQGPPLVSVVMNGFNSARYLREAIQSLLDQTYQNWELVFWDNCSTDETETIVTRFEDARIRFYVAPRLMSLAEGRNHAIDLARGDWIAFLDCDDMWLPAKLELQMTLVCDADSDRTGLVYCRSRSFSKRGDEGETSYQFTGKQLPEGEVLEELLLQGNFIPLVSAMISRSAWLRVRPIPVEFTFAEDYWLFLAVAEKYRVVCCQQALACYRVHEHSATANNRLLSHLEALEVMTKWSHYLTPSASRRRKRQYRALIGIEKVRSGNQVLHGIIQVLASRVYFWILRGALSTGYRRWILRNRSFS
ncbi:MAG TPA: hypothetical protein DCF45_09230 [Gammaproteobacteria bacterium]|nr:hypothetical protein [Gammaproteobacteria bacterium]